MIDRQRLHQGAKRRSFYTTMAQIAAAGRHMRRRRDKRIKRKSLLRMLMSGPERTDGIQIEPVQIEPALPGLKPEAVRIAVLAMENLGRASLRASFSGRPVEVNAPDEATAAIFRAALAETARVRSTDRLIRVTVAAA